MNNLKAALYDPVISRGYYELAKHYGFVIDPCRARRPEHKGGVENDVKYVKRSFWRNESWRRGPSTTSFSAGRPLF